jgi:hypothetical protein
MGFALGRAAMVWTRYASPDTESYDQALGTQERHVIATSGVAIALLGITIAV